jgi:sugar O-acyltransferase (sialic acid O-acetyltransferase NeuD family)
MQKVVIIGAGGLAREVLDILEAINQQKPQYEILGFIVDQRFGKPGSIINDLPILGDYHWLAAHIDSVRAICAVGSPELRYHLVKRAEAIGCQFITAIHPTVIRNRYVQIGVNTVISAGCILTNQIRIGSHVYLNLACTVGHDCHIQDYATILPGVRISGNVIIEEGAYIGSGTTIIEKKTIGRWSIIGAGSVVIRDIDANTTAVGVPAKIIKRRTDGWHLTAVQ